MAQSFRPVFTSSVLSPLLMPFTQTHPNNTQHQTVSHLCSLHTQSLTQKASSLTPTFPHHKKTPGEGKIFAYLWKLNLNTTFYEEVSQTILYIHTLPHPPRHTQLLIVSGSVTLVLLCLICTFL